MTMRAQWRARRASVFGAAIVASLGAIASNAAIAQDNQTDWPIYRGSETTAR
jgi:hypothetical protein